MKKSLSLILILSIALYAFSQDKKRKVLMIGIDGCRADALSQALTPNIDTIMAHGAYSLQAQTGNYTVSGSGWSNTFTGVWENKHLVEDNTFNSGYPNVSQYPHIFKYIKDSRPDLKLGSIESWKINKYIINNASYMTDQDYFTQRILDGADFLDYMNARITANYLTHAFKPNYKHTTIPYAYVDILNSGATTLSLGDDEVTNAINIGFSFEFYGTTYSHLYISSNGYVSFSSPDLSQPYDGSGCCESQPLADAYYPNNIIALAWEDLDPPNGNGSISYQTFGTAPNRHFIIQFKEVEHTQSTDKISAQVILYETTNNIELHYDELNMDDGFHSIGVENIDGSVGHSIKFDRDGLLFNNVAYKLTYEPNNIERDPDVLFIYFRDVDEKGHDHGFDLSISSYMNQIEMTDNFIGEIMDSLKSRPTYDEEDWLITLSTDHGGICDTYFTSNICTGNGGGHTGYQNEPEVKTIFFVASGDNITTQGQLSPAPNIVDLAPTVLDFLCIPIDPNWSLDGQSRGLACPKPVIDFNYNVNGFNISFNDTIFNQGCDSISLIWDFDDSTTSTISDPSHTFTNSGTYNVCLNVSNECGTTTKCKTITYVFTSNDIEKDNSIFNIKPNPSDGLIDLIYNETCIYDINIYDNLGRLLYTKKNNHTNQQKLDLSVLLPGQYFLEIRSRNKSIIKPLILN